MSAERDVTPIVRNWLQDGVTSLPDHVLDRVFDQVPAIRQERGWLAGWRNTAMQNALKLALAAAAVIAVVVAGLNLVPRSETSVVGPPSSPNRQRPRRRCRLEPRCFRPASRSPKSASFARRAGTCAVATVRVRRRAPRSARRVRDDPRHDVPAARNVRVLLPSAHDVFRSMWPRAGRPADRTDRRRSRAGASRDPQHLNDRAGRFHDWRSSGHVSRDDHDETLPCQAYQFYIWDGN